MLVVGVVLHHGGSDDGGRSVVYSCEVTVPEKGIGLNALLGSSARTEEYLSVAGSVLSKQSNGEIESTGDKLVKDITTLLGKGDTKGASTRLDKFLASQKEQPSEKIVKTLVNTIFNSALPGLETENMKRGPYAPAMITSLLERHMIHDEMVKGGVVAAALLPLGDWVSRSIPSSMQRSTDRIG